MENSLKIFENLRNLSNVCATDDIWSHLLWRYIGVNRSLLDWEYQRAVNLVSIYQTTTFLSDMFKIRSYATALDDLFVNYAFKSGLFTFLRNMIRPILNDWHLLLANSTHTATTALFWKNQPQTRKTKNAKNWRVPSTLKDNPYKPYFFEFCIQLSIFTDIKLSF